jgi:hypothetical protein
MATEEFHSWLLGVIVTDQTAASKNPYCLGAIGVSASKLEKT